MGLSSLRRHRGGYIDPKVAAASREATREELATQLAEERAKSAKLEAQIAKLGGATIEEIEAAFNRLRDESRAEIEEARKYAEEAHEHAKSMKAELEALKASTPPPEAEAAAADLSATEGSTPPAPEPPPPEAEGAQPPPRAPRRR